MVDHRLPTELRHIYRSLLRAATYLPDAEARLYIHNHVVHRFRSVSRRIERRAKRGISSDNIIERHHGSENIALARKRAKQLELAAQGSAPELTQVLHRTYGRMGRRRRELMWRLIRADISAASVEAVPVNDSAVRSLIRRVPEIPAKPTKADLEKKTRMFSPTSQIMALMKSQMANRPVEMTLPPIRHLNPKIPDENIWGRPMPLRRHLSIAKKHWRSALSKVMPPLPKHEWERLRDLATGVIPAEGLVPRRGQRVRIPAAGESNEERLLRYFTTATNMHSSDFDEIRVDAETGATAWAPPIRTLEIPPGKHATYTPRHLRRLYAGIWNITPMASLQPDTKKWVVKWGGNRSPSHDGHFSKAAVEDIELWDDLPEDSPPTPKSKRGSKK